MHFSFKDTQEVLPSIVYHGNTYFLKSAKVTFQSYYWLQKDSLRKQKNNCCPAKKLQDKKAVTAAAGFVLLFFLWMGRKPHSFLQQLHLCCRCHNECQVKAVSWSNWSSSFQGTGKQHLQLLSDQSRNTFAQCVRLHMIELPLAVTFLQSYSFLLHKNPQSFMENMENSQSHSFIVGEGGFVNISFRIDIILNFQDCLCFGLNTGVDWGK